MFAALKKRNMNQGEIQQHICGFESFKSAWLMLSAVNWTCWSVNDATKVKQRHFLMFFPGEAATSMVVLDETGHL